MLDITQTIDNLHAAKGGPSRTVVQLSQALSTCPDTLISIICADTGSTPTPGMHAASATASNFVALYSGNIYREVRRTNTGKNSADIIIHDNGLWRVSNLLAAVSARRLNVPYVISPHGMLESWALQHHRLRKQLALTAYQGWCLRHATGFHATCFAEAESIRRMGMRQPIAVIGNGIEGAPTTTVQKSTSTRTALFLSRLHPKKGVLELVEAWAKVRPAGWNLRIVGPDEGGYRRKLDQAINSHGMTHNIVLAGEVNDKEKWIHYQQAQLFVLPTHSENFGLVIGEALAAGLPVITTTETPWKSIADKGCGWIIRPTEEALSNALEEATRLPIEHLMAMGKIGQAWIPQEFSWRSIAKQMRDYYLWLLNGGKENTRPSFVV